MHILLLLSLAFCLQPLLALPLEPISLPAIFLLETETPTITPSVTPTGSAAPSATLTNTPQLTATQTPAVTSTSTTSFVFTPTPTFGLAATLTPTFTIPPVASESPSPTPFEPTITPTYIPLPAITFVQPGSQTTNEMLLNQRQPGEIEKQRLSPFANALWRLWPLGLVLLVWGGLAVWLVLLQKHLN